MHTNTHTHTCTCIHTHTHTPPSESNLQQLAALDISSASGKGSSRNPDCTLPELYLSSDGGRNLRVRLTRGRVLVPDAPLHPFWVAVVPWVIDRLVEQLYPWRTVRVFLLSADCLVPCRLIPHWSTPAGEKLSSLGMRL